MKATEIFEEIIGREPSEAEQRGDIALPVLLQLINGGPLDRNEPISEDAAEPTNPASESVSTAPDAANGAGPAPNTEPDIT